MCTEDELMHVASKGHGHPTLGAGQTSGNTDVQQDAQYPHGPHHLVTDHDGGYTRGGC